MAIADLVYEKTRKLRERLAEESAYIDEIRKEGSIP